MHFPMRVLVSLSQRGGIDGESSMRSEGGGAMEYCRRKDRREAWRERREGARLLARKVSVVIETWCYSTAARNCERREVCKAFRMTKLVEQGNYLRSKLGGADEAEISSHPLCDPFPSSYSVFSRSRISFKASLSSIRL
jgi:hypothetical protein